MPAKPKSETPEEQPPAQTSTEAPAETAAEEAPAETSAEPRSPLTPDEFERLRRTLRRKYH